MSKRRIRFSKLNMAKYISHLDLLRCFTRSIMRSGLPVVYSQGFNPHQRLTFALPLPVGVTSECETVDILFEDGIVTDHEIKEKLNANLPPDIQVIYVGDAEKKAADIVCAEYTLTIRSCERIGKKAVDAFFAKEEVIAAKKTKKNDYKPINIMGYIKAWEILSEAENELVLRLVLDAGSERNLKPDAVLKAFCDEYPSAQADDADICRKKIFCKSDDNKTLELFV